MPRFRVEAAIIDNGRVLLVKDRRIPCWRLPGGEVAAGEGVLDALARLIAEQAGLQIRPGRLVGLYSRPHWRHGGDTTALLLGLTIGGVLRVGASVRDAQHFSPRALPESLLPWYGERIADALAGQQRAFVRQQDVAWPFPEEDDQAVVAWLIQQGSDADRAVRDSLRRLAISLSDAEIAQLVASIQAQAG